MKADIQDLRDTFKIGYEAFEESRLEANEVWNMFHNRQWTEDQLTILANRGQPAETFNVVKLFARMLLGYYSTVINTTVASPVKIQDIYTASLISDLINYTYRHNNFIAEGEKIKLSGIISGLMCSYTDVVDTGRKDQFGRPIYDITLEHVPDSEIVLDPMSHKDDYTDARYIHRFKWLSEEAMVELFGQSKVNELDEYYNFLNIDEAEFEYNYNYQFAGEYRVHNNYLVVHSIMKTDDGKTWSCFWSNETMLSKKEVTFKDVPSPYRVQKLHTSDITEYYGLFREVKESQKAINQALIKIQLMVNTQKAFVEEGAVESMSAFTDAFNRVTAVIPVKDLAGIKVEALSREVLDQYAIIDKAFDRIQRILSINDSFLGMAFASDSGRKVKLQQNATIIALRYLTGRLESYYRSLSWDIANLVKQYYTATQAIRIADETTGERWLEINRPMEQWTGQMQNGQPVMEYVYEEVLDPATGEPYVDEEGNIVVAPIPEGETEIAFTDVNIEINTVAYNDEDEKNQLMLETILTGGIGQMLAQVNPAGYFKAASLSIKTMKTKHSPDISMILEQTAQALGGSPEAAQEASNMAQASNGGGGGGSPKSDTMKLPQNTNEGSA